MKKLFIVSLSIIFTCTYNDTHAQQYKLKQSTNMGGGMKIESTIYVKGMRKRTESSGIMGFGAGVITIEQCDLQRTVKFNDKKKLFFIEPFAKDDEEVIDEDAPKTKVIPNKQNNTVPQKGGVITQWYSIRDTNERKTIFGFPARHVWTYRKTKPSPDACYMKDSMEMKTDGWYIDLPKFNCPVTYKPVRPPRQQNEKPQPQCTDKFVTHRSGKGKLGFPLTETTTIIMGNMQGREITTSIETSEFSTAQLDSMLFDIPPGYTETKNEDDLQDKTDVKDMMKNVMKEMKEDTGPGIYGMMEKKPGIIRIGVYAPTGDEQVQGGMLQKKMVGSLINDKVDAIPVASEEDARKYNCDYTLTSVFTKIKSANKIGGLLKAIKNADPNAASSFNIEANLTLKLLSDGSIKTQPKIGGKYDGKVDDAAAKAMDEGCKEVLKVFK